MRKFVLAAALVLLTVVLAPVPASAEPAVDASDTLREAVTLDAMRAHQQAFQDFADANGNVRASGTVAYDLSADYVEQLMVDAGYVVEREEFEFPYFELTDVPILTQTAPDAVDYIAETDFSPMRFSGSGDVTALVSAVDLSLDDREASTSGCEIEDFADFPAGNIALIQRGACAFSDKATNAEASGAVGVIVFNQGDTEEREEVLFGTLGSPDASTLPAVGASFALGEALNVDGAEARIVVSALSETRTTTNVVATSVTGDQDNVVMAGAHLDSVPEGPGIQDNGTGSAAILEIALQLQEQFGVNDEGDDSLVNAVRFGWWGAEEFGLLGSIDYVTNLTDEELDGIAVYQNYDMIGSPNFARFVYDGDSSDAEATIDVPPSSATLENVFLDYFADQGLPTQATLIGQRSDHFAFCVSGIACGGLFTGAEGIKTAEEVALYGGVEGEQYDQCYHAECDTFDNINLEAFDQNGDAAAHALTVYAFSPLCNGLPATIVGSEGVDDIRGTQGDDVIVTLGGDDIVFGRAGNDTICLGRGSDVGNGGSGDDVILGEAGTDDLRGAVGNDIIDGGAGPDTIRGGGYDDYVLGGSMTDSIDGGPGNDTIDGGSGDDTINAGSGEDNVDGGSGADTIYSGSGADRSSGGTGQDLILGQGGDDLLDGADGIDELRGDDGDDTCQNGEILRSCETAFTTDPENFADGIATPESVSGGGGGGVSAGGLAPDHDGHDHGPPRVAE